MGSGEGSFPCSHSGNQAVGLAIFIAMAARSPWMPRSSWQKRSKRVPRITRDVCKGLTHVIYTHIPLTRNHNGVVHVGSEEVREGLWGGEIPAET